MKKMLGLAITLLVASPASAGDMLRGEPYYTGIYLGEPLSVDILPDPFSSQPTVRANFVHSFAPFSGSIKIRKSDFSESQYQHTHQFEEVTTSGSMEFIDRGVVFNEFTIDKQFVRESEFLTSGNSFILEGTVENSGATVTFESYISVDF